MDVQELIAAIQSRPAGERWGIGTVKHYLKQAEPFALGTIATPDQWQKALADAEGVLAWCDEEMADPTLIGKSYNDGAGLPSGFCASFDCVVTSSRKDRDGDMLEPLGLDMDKAAPLLYQHIPLQPTGRLLTEKGRDADRILGSFGLVDTAFGRDNAILVKTGCVRISHGFKPYLFEPIEHKGAQDGVPRGWRVKRGEIREVSLVSIPSNVDAVITAFSQGQFSSEPVKRWAKACYDARPTVVPVQIDLSINGQKLTVKAAAEPEPKPAEPEPKPAEPEPKPAEPEPAKAAGEPITDNRVQLCVKSGDQFMPIEEQLQPLVFKAGRVLSCRNKDKIKAAHGELKAVLDAAEKESDDLEIKAGRVLRGELRERVDRARGQLEEVIADAGGWDNPEDLIDVQEDMGKADEPLPTVEDMARWIAASAFASGDLGQLDKAIGCLTKAAQSIEAMQKSEELLDLLGG